MDWIALRSKAVDSVKKYRFALLVVLLGLALMLIPGKAKDAPETTTNKPTTSQQQDDLSARLKEILSQINGAGRVEVMLSVAQGEKTLYQSNQDSTGGDNESIHMDTVIINDENRAQSGLIQQILPPVYQGAIIVCQGADHPSVRLAIVDAVSKITGLGADRISVLKMK